MKLANVYSYLCNWSNVFIHFKISIASLFKYFSFLWCGFLLVACTAVKPFTLAPGEATARIETMFDEGLQICIDGKVSTLKPVAGYYEVPAGKLVTLYTRRVLTRHLNHVNYCSTSISAIPKQETAYLLNLKVRYLSCELQMLELNRQGKMVAILEPAAVHLPCFYDKYFRTNFGDEFVP